LTTLFISDLHLESERPDITQQFLGFLEAEAASADALYVLGDLFDVWVGDDDDQPLVADIAAALRRLSDSGVTCYFAHGNRDFMLGPEYAGRAGFTLLPEWTVLTRYGDVVLVGHGDDLCTDDHEYMAFRKMVRDPQWQQNMRQLPLPQRRQLAAQARQQSQLNTASKAMDIMDVNDIAVAALLKTHGVSAVLHGHTHRPAVHHFTVDQTDATRIVLGDWYEQGSLVRWDESGFALGQLAR
jgi:UDP-2,3-diacylglucosamine hydrolase